MSQKVKQINTYKNKVANSRTLGELIEYSKSTESHEQKLIVLKELLGYAVTLEFATIPIYLTSIWTIKDNTSKVASSIRNILQEEMLHMSMVCNMLVGIGGEPKIYTTNNRLSFPTKLPGDVHPELFLYLEGLNDCSIRNFMEIELPDKIADLYDYDTKEKVELTKLCDTVSDNTNEASTGHDHKYNSTIGELYDRIDNLFKELQPKMDTERQLAGSLAWFVMADYDSVHKAIEFIKEQGEGSEDVTPESTGIDDLAHFYRFWEVYYKKKITEEDGKYYFKDPLPRPETFNIARIPEGGYKKENVSPEVWHLIEEFDITYSKLVMLLEDAWAEDGGGQASLVKGVEIMFNLEKYAIPLLQIPIPGNSEGLNYGPCFRILDVH